MDNIITGVKVVKSKNNSSEDFLATVILRALDDSHAVIGEANAKHIGIFVGSTLSNFFTRDSNIKRYYREEIREANPAEVPKNLLSYLGGYLSIKLNIQGAINTLSSGCSSGVDALIQALYFLKRHSLNKAVVVELEESLSSRLGGVAGASCFILENSSARGRKKCYGKIEVIEAFFEKEGEDYGLSQAINKIIGKYRLSFQNINFVFGGLSSLADALKLKSSLNFLSKTSSAILFMNLGHNSNSSCGIIRTLRLNKHEK